MHGIAWSAPIVAVTAAAPAFAASYTPVATFGAALKWTSKTDDLKHVSWDLTLQTVNRAISSVSIAFAYAPNGGGGSPTFTQLAVHGFSPMDATWSVSTIPSTGTNAVTATHGAIAANTTYFLHTDFAGSDNSTGSVTATITITYVGGAVEVLPPLSTAWVQATPGNVEPPPHDGH